MTSARAFALPFCVLYAFKKTYVSVLSSRHDQGCGYPICPPVGTLRFPQGRVGLPRSTRGVRDRPVAQNHSPRSGVCVIRLTKRLSLLGTSIECQVCFLKDGNLFFGVLHGRLLESLPRPKSPGAAECSALGKWRLRRTRRPIGIGRFGGHYVCPLDEAVGALTSTPEEGNGVLLGVPFPSCLRGVNHARHCMGHDVEFDDDSLKSQLHRNSFLFFFFAS